MNKGKIYGSLTAFLILVLVLSVNASIKVFVNVDKENEADHKIKVTLSQSKDTTYKFKIYAPMVNIKRAWLFICKKQLKKQDQEFRQYIWWKKESKRSDIIKQIPLYADKNQFLHFTLEEKFINRSYVYIDFAGVIVDGGFYYSIDLFSYLENKK